MTIAAQQYLPPHLQMLVLGTGHFVSQAIYVAAKLGIADLLKDVPKTAAELSRVTATHAESLYRLLRALASIGVFAEDGGGRFCVTPLAATLQSDSPNSIRAALLLGGSDFHQDAWRDLMYSIQTGESAFEHVHGMRFFEYLASHAGAEALFGAWMTRSSELNNPAIVSCYDFSRFRTIVDVGGGQGSLLAAILKANPATRGVLFDLAGVMEAARRSEAVELRSRCEMVEGNFFEAVPRGGDLYLLKTVVHDWDDELSIAILGNCKEAMAGHSRLLVIESIVPGGNAPHASKFMDLNMLVLNHGGRERSEGEYRLLFERAGLEVTSITGTASPYSLIEGRVRRPEDSV
jgi:hypothetical protein